MFMLRTVSTGCPWSSRIISAISYRIMPRNVEIKAKVQNIMDLEAKVKTLATGEANSFYQEDTFYSVNRGRLKLRFQTEQNPQLIFYVRPNTDGPKLSSYQIVELSDEKGREMQALLSMALGNVGTVKKDRTLYMVGQTRIHLDKVEGIGNFLEFEVVLREDQTHEDGQKISEDLMVKLGVETRDLIDCAYVDIINHVKPY